MGQKILLLRTSGSAASCSEDGAHSWAGNRQTTGKTNQTNNMTTKTNNKTNQTNNSCLWFVQIPSVCKKELKPQQLIWVFDQINSFSFRSTEIYKLWIFTFISPELCSTSDTSCSCFIISILIRRPADEQVELQSSDIWINLTARWFLLLHVFIVQL